MRPIDFRIPRAGERWRNHKGTLYHIDHIGTQTETGEPDVAYFPADKFEDYRRGGPDAVSWYHRPLGIFLGSTKNAEGAHVQRFTLEQEVDQ